MSRAVVLGGSGVLGRAIATRLLDDGWEVEVTGRDPAHFPTELAESGASFAVSDRREAGDLAAVLGAGADLLVDLACYTEDDARLAAPFLADVTSTVMVSTKGVYVDEFGNHSNSPVKPVFPFPITEQQPTVRPGRGDFTTREGYAANKIAAEQTLLDTGAPVTVLRASKVHGAGAFRPREWVFLKRAVDGREQLLLAHRGLGGDHTTAAVNLAALVATAAQRPGARILNSADPDAPNGLEIARAVAAHAGHRFEEVLLDDDVDPAYGAHPWDTVPPIVLDLTAAAALGYQPVGTFAETVGAELDWLLLRHELGETAALDDDPFFTPYLDYRLEDAYLLLRSVSS